MADSQFTKRGRTPVHGHTLGHKESRTYRTWRSMLNRCYRVRDASYARYGALGVRVCDRWRSSFTAFLEDMGERPEGCSIDRIDPSGNYEPSNCRWATAIKQIANQRTVRERHTRQNKWGQTPKVTHCKHGHEYTPENSLFHKDGFRFCRACRDARNHRYYENRIKPRIASRG